MLESLCCARLISPTRANTAIEPRERLVTVGRVASTPGVEITSSVIGFLGILKVVRIMIGLNLMKRAISRMDSEWSAFAKPYVSFWIYRTL